MKSQRRCAALDVRVPEAVAPEKYHMQESSEASSDCATWLSEIDSLHVKLLLNTNARKRCARFLPLISSLLRVSVFILIHTSVLWLHSCCRHENATDLLVLDSLEVHIRNLALGLPLPLPRKEECFI